MGGGSEMKNTIEVKHKHDLKQIKRSVERARAWAKRHFNSEEALTQTGLLEQVAGELRMVKPAAFVRFPDVDTMTVQPAVMGRPLGVVMCYRLCFESDGRLSWRGTHPFWGTPLPPLYVED